MKRRRTLVVPGVEPEESYSEFGLHGNEMLPGVPFSSQLLSITEKVDHADFAAMTDSLLKPEGYQSKTRGKLNKSLLKLQDSIVNNPNLDQDMEVEIQMAMLLQQKQRQVAKEEARQRAKMEKIKQLERQRVAEQEALIEKKHKEALAIRERAIAAGKACWVESFDPDHHACYYYNHETGETTWEKPDFYVVAAEDDEMKAVIRIQCAYRAKLARRAKRERDEKAKKEWHRKMHNYVSV